MDRGATTRASPPASAEGDHANAAAAADRGVDSIDLTDSAGLWRAVTERLARESAFAWVQHARLVGVEGDAMTLAPASGRQELARFATADRLRQLAQHVTAVAGRPMTVRFDAPPSDAPAAADPASGGTLSRDAASRRAAMDLPLVREAFEVFPEATLLDVRSEDG